jgi:hypothetical protein
MQIFTAANPSLTRAELLTALEYDQLEGNLEFKSDNGIFSVKDFNKLIPIEAMRGGVYDFSAGSTSDADLTAVLNSKGKGYKVLMTRSSDYGYLAHERDITKLKVTDHQNKNTVLNSTEIFKGITVAIDSKPLTGILIFALLDR